MSPSSQPNVASIPSNYSRLIARVLKLQRQQLPLLLAHTGLSSEQFLQDEMLLNPQQQIQILENALSLSNNDAFGLSLGKLLTPPTHGAMGFLANSSADLLTALKAFQTYSPTRMSFIRVELAIRDNWLACSYHIELEVTEPVRRCLTEVSAMTFFECAAFILGRPLDEAVIDVSFDKPDYWARYKDYIPGEVAFSQAVTEMRIPLEVCLEPNISANHEDYLVALNQCESMLAQLHSNKNSCKYQIEKMMLSHPPGVLCEEEAAAAMLVSKRTLARRLQKEGTGFRQIRDEILSKQAARYLSDSQMSVDAIAALLNYHDSANFRRAFKRWYKMSPDQYRKTQRLA